MKPIIAALLVLFLFQGCASLNQRPQAILDVPRLLYLPIVQVEKELGTLHDPFPYIPTMGIRDYTREPIRLQIDFDTKTGVVSRIYIYATGDKHMTKGQLCAYAGVDPDSKQYKVDELHECCSPEIFGVEVRTLKQAGEDGF